MQERKFIPKNIFTARLSIEIGKKIRENYPAVLNDYISGMTLREIVDRYNLKEKYNTGIVVVSRAITRAIYGHNGNFDIPGYDGLGDKELLNDVRRKRQVDSGSKIYKERKGIFSGTLDKLKISSHAGKTAHELRVGIHGASREKMSQRGRKGGISSAIKRGLVPWSNEDEIRMLKDLAKNPKYAFRNKVNVSLIALEINNRFYNNEPIRSAEAVGHMLRRIRENGLENRL